MKYKEFLIKAAEADNGTLEGYASTWIREPDAYGDVVKQGAFKNSLERIKAEGKKIPLIWSHQMDNLKSYIGTCEAEEDDKGLHFIATFDSSDDAQKVRQMYKDGRLSKFSFAYNVLDQAEVTLEDGRKANELRELEIFEISCVLVPANPDASMTEVKQGKRNSAKDEELIREAIKYLQLLLEDAGELTDEEDTKDGEENQSGDKSADEDQKLINLQKFEMLQLIKTYETDLNL